jgi:hypothetical protein
MVMNNYYKLFYSYHYQHTMSNHHYQHRMHNLSQTKIMMAAVEAVAEVVAAEVVAAVAGEVAEEVAEEVVGVEHLDMRFHLLLYQYHLKQ